MISRSNCMNYSPRSEMSEGWSELCVDEDVEGLILAKVEGSGLSSHMKEMVWREVEKEGVRVGDVEETTYNTIASSGLGVQLKNAVYQELMRLHQRGIPPLLDIPLEHRKEPLDFVREAQEEWEVKLRRGVNTLCTELGVPLARERTPQERESLRKKWNSIGTDFPDLERLHPIFSPKDLLEVVIRVRDPNFVPCGAEQPDDSCDDVCGLMQVQLATKSLHELKEQFSSLHPSVVQVENALAGNYESEYTDKVLKVLQKGLCPLARQLCKTGCLVGHRRALWCAAMGVDPDLPQHAFHFEELKSSVLKHNLLFERLMVKDVKKTAANDDGYFVFEDTMHQVLLALLHDTSLLQHFEHFSVSPLKAYIRGNVGVPEYEVVYPPSGIVPFHGFSMYISPLCYIFDRSDHLYALFKEMYTRFFVHLHCISSHSEGILSLCCQFESLLQAKQPELFQHLRKIHADPLRLVFGWLVSVFAGYLDTHEVLLLWDRIVGFNTLTVLPVLAVAVLEFRATNLFKATSLSEAEAILSDVRCLKVLPLLQQTLFL